MAWPFSLVLVSLVSLPIFALSFRPVHVPKNLFVQTPVAPQDGTRIIRRSAGFNWQDGTKEDGSFASEQSVLKVRSRRDVAGVPENSGPFTFPLAENFDSLMMYWPSDSNKILLLGTPFRSGVVAKSSVYLSEDYGKNWTKINSKLTLRSGSASSIDNIYISKTAATLCILSDTTNKALFVSKDMSNFVRYDISWQPSFIYIHPTDVKYVMGFDKIASKLYWSSNSGGSFQLAAEQVKSFSWGEIGIDSADTIYVEKFRSNNTKLSVIQRRINLGDPTIILDSVDDFEVIQNFMFATQTDPSDKSIKLLVSHNRKLPFVDAKFPSMEKNKDFFVYDVDDDQVFVVINHLQNKSSMYVSDYGGVKYSLSIPRVLYHNPFTDVSSPWLRATVRYAFVDVHKVHSMKGVYVATQLTPGPVGRRHLLTLITYNKGGLWQRIRAPGQDINGQNIYCYLPGCSLHFNLLYGSVYRVSPSERFLSRPSAPGLILALGVASTNLKIHPDLYLSVDGGVSWKRALRGKYQYAFGDHGSIIIAVPYRRNTRILKYTYDGGDTWFSYIFSSKSVQVHDVVTQLEEKLPIFLIYGSTSSRSSRPWNVFFVNMTRVLGRACTPNDFTQWVPSDPSGVRQSSGEFTRCLLGRHTEFQVRNWTVRCLVGKDYIRKQNERNCACRRADFQCDFGFQRRTLDEECSKVPDKDMNANLIPDNCAEGEFYNRSIGYRKIPGDTCTGGEEQDFAPVLTKCPAEDLKEANLSSPKAVNGSVAVSTGTEVPFAVTLETPYWPNIRLRWDFGDIKTGFVDTVGKNGSTQSHVYSRPGHYIAHVTITNTRSILIKKMHIYVQDMLNTDKVDITFTPSQPSVNDSVVFTAKLRDYKFDTYGHVHFQWSINGNKLGNDQPFVTYRFGKSGLYNVTASASNLVNNIQKTVTVKVKPDLRPVNVQAHVLSPSSVHIEWDKPQGSDEYIKSYKVFKSMSSSTDFHLVLTVSDKTEGTVRELKSATTYYFKVSALTKTGDDFFSEPIVVMTNSSKLGKPENLEAVNLTVTSIKLSWKPPLQGADQVIGYRIRRWSSTKPSVTTEDVARDVLQKEFKNLNQDTVYYFEVIAFSSVASSVSAGPVFTRSGVSKPALAPRDIQHVTDNGTCAYISWETPFFSRSDQSLFPAKGYRVYLEKQFVKGVEGKHTQVCGLSPGISYTVQVAAYSASGEGPRGTVSFTTKMTKVNAPRNLKAKATSPKKIRISWDPPALVDGKSLAYVIKVTPPVHDKPSTVSARIGVFVVDGLQPFTSYTFTVGVHPGVSLSVQATTLEDIPGAPESVVAELIAPKSSTIKLSWSQPSSPNGLIIEYKIEWRSSAEDSNREVIVKALTGIKLYSYTFKNLGSNTKYVFSVRAKNSAGQSPRYSEEVTQLTNKVIKGTERLQMTWDGPDLPAENIESVNQDFIVGASKFTKIKDTRFAAVDVRRDKKVQFDLLPPPQGVEALSSEDAKDILNNGFTMGTRTTVASSLKVVSTYGDDGNGAVVPSAGAQTGEKSSVSNVWVIGIIIPIVIIGIALLAGMVFYYRKYKALERHYSKTVYRTSDNQLNMIYDGLTTESPGVTYSDNQPKKKFFKDSEKIPLGENDELSMV